MATAKPKAAVTQFLFAADSGSSSIIASRINADGSLAPVSGSPFPFAEAPRKVSALGNSLIVAGGKTLTAFAVDSNSGALQATDSLAPFGDASFDFVVDAQAAVLYAASREQVMVFRLSAGKFQAMSASANPISSAAFAQAADTPAMDASGRFVYFADSARSQIIAFRFDGARLAPLSPPFYPAGRRPLSLAVVVP